jgi:hypothetical protein
VLAPMSSGGGPPLWLRRGVVTRGLRQLQHHVGDIFCVDVGNVECARRADQRADGLQGRQPEVESHAPQIVLLEDRHGQQLRRTVLIAERHPTTAAARIRDGGLNPQIRCGRDDDSPDIGKSLDWTTDPRKNGLNEQCVPGSQPLSYYHP